MLRKFIAAAAAIMVCLFVAGPANAAPYQLDFISSGQLRPGDSATIHGNGYRANSSVELRLVCTGTTVTLGSLPTDEVGVFDGSLTIPPGTTLGACEVQAVGRTSSGETKVLKYAIRIVDTVVLDSGPISGIPQLLPKTGAAVRTTLEVAAGLVLLGVVALFASRLGRKRRFVEI
jgi:LPXTG-motif cell wall-anchored protein